MFGGPSHDLGTEVNAAVRAMSGLAGDTALEQGLLAVLREHLSRLKCPYSVDFTDPQPHLRNGGRSKKPAWVAADWAAPGWCRKAGGA